jgi:hypothetical protein
MFKIENIKINFALYKNETSGLNRLLGLRYVVVVVIANIKGLEVYKKVALIIWSSVLKLNQIHLNI